MGTTPKENYDRLVRATTAWEMLRPQKTFASLTLDQFRDRIAPSLAERASIARLESEIAAAQNRRRDADNVSLGTLQFVINAIKTDPAEGEDGDLYEAMVYIRKSERKPDLHRTKNPTQTQSS